MNEEQKVESGLFKLYRCVDKHTGLAFQSYRCREVDDGAMFAADGNPQPYFTELGNFYRTLKSMKRILYHCTHKCTRKDEHGFWVPYSDREEIPKRIDRYYVEVYQVLQLSKIRIDGREFFKKDALEKLQERIYKETHEGTKEETKNEIYI